MNTDTFISSDVEADGPLVGHNSMLSFASVAMDINKNILGKFSRNLELIPNGVQDPDTMNFWNRTPQNQKAYEATRIDTVDIEQAMKEYVAWLNTFNSTVFLGFPAPYDFKWIDYYCQRWAKTAPFGHSRVLDIKALAFGLLKLDNFGYSTKRNYPKRWFDKLPHTHIAIDDAIEQGALGINILREMYSLPKIEISDIESSTQTV